MPKYNIIYTTPNDEIYIWNGTSLDKLDEAEHEVLMFSGKTVKEEEIQDAMDDCKKAIKELFPNDKDPSIKTVEIAVSD